MRYDKLDVYKRQRQDGKEYNLGDTLKTGACEVRVDVRLTERRDMWEKWGIEVREIALTSPAGTKKYPYRGDLFCVQAEGDRWLRVELYGDCLLYTSRCV